MASADVNASAAAFKAKLDSTRRAFATGKSKSVQWRKQQLKVK